MHLQAQWAAIRSFHRAARRIGDSPSGQPLFAIGSVELTLPRGAQRFCAEVACARCGQLLEVPILNSADLALGVQSRFCRVCGAGAIAIASGPNDTSEKALRRREISRTTATAPNTKLLPSQQSARPASQVGEGETAESVAPDLEEGLGALEVSPGDRVNGNGDRAKDTFPWRLDRSGRNALGEAQAQATTQVATAEAKEIRQVLDHERETSAAAVAEAQERAMALRTEAGADAGRARQAAEQAAAALGEAQAQATTHVAAAEAQAKEIRQAVDQEREQSAAAVAEAQERAMALRTEAEADAGRVRHAVEQAA
ncbi:MAG: hypothetical protein ACR2GF_03010, partial [Acidimicrobiales bacterium]